MYGTVDQSIRSQLDTNQWQLIVVTQLVDLRRLTLADTICRTCNHLSFEYSKVRQQVCGKKD